jgi:hypothetical protein
VAKTTSVCWNNWRCVPTVCFCVLTGAYQKCITKSFWKILVHLVLWWVPRCSDDLCWLAFSVDDFITEKSERRAWPGFSYRFRCNRCSHKHNPEYHQRNINDAQRWVVLSTKSWLDDSTYFFRLQYWRFGGWRRDPILSRFIYKTGRRNTRNTLKYYDGDDAGRRCLAFSCWQRGRTL